MLFTCHESQHDRLQVLKYYLSIGKRPIELGGGRDRGGGAGTSLREALNVRLKTLDRIYRQIAYRETGSRVAKSAGFRRPAC